MNNGNTMGSFNHADQLALLLNVLGREATETALSGLDADISSQVRDALEGFRLEPPSKEEIEYALDDFAKYFRFALHTVGIDSEKAKRKDAVDHPNESVANKEEDKRFPVPQLTGDTIADLAKLDPYQIAYSLRNDHSKTITLVLQHLPTPLAARTLELVPEPLQREVFLEYSKPTTVPRKIVDKVLATVLEKAMSVEFRQTDNDSSTKLADLARSLSNKVRGPMLEELSNCDDELAAAVKAKMYQFADLERLDDRAIQALLGQINTETLALALQNSSQTIMDRLLGNISKRARQTLEEEIEFKSSAKLPEVEAARQEIVALLAKLDESGEITLE
jgi:flagellar motor switch protein FliG